MTALERAKAFINTRAAKTALRIMPLAVAAAVAVSVVPKAHADATLVGTTATWTYGHCSGGANACLDTSSGIESVSFNYPGGGAVTGSGGLSGVVGQQNGPLELQFSIGGSGSGTYNDNVAFGGKFLVTCSGCDPSDTFSYDVAATVDGTPYTSSTISFSPGTTLTLPTVLIPTTNGDPVMNDLWNASITFHWNAVVGDQATFQPVNLTLDPKNPTTPTVPEPASMLLAIAGLPFLRRFIRKR